MAGSRLLCPVCSGLLGHDSDLESQWDRCYSCGRQYHERSLSRAVNSIPYSPPERGRAKGRKK
jgi:hypothetical protein